ncbi:MAG: T9SS type A sorting domain-containing protein [Sphingobacteriales bacterium]|nr:MAG: T9SS type A sorting domain-containing protein [Sphingobacteriales bacterium]
MKKLFYFFALSFFLLSGYSASAQAIPGNDFEQWLLGQPSSWLTSSLADSKSAQKTNDAYHGQSAIRLETVENVSEEGDTAIMPGFAYSGTIGFNDITLGFPFAARPKSLSFYFKYLPVDQDSMVVAVVLRKTGGEFGPETVGSAFYKGSGKKETYTYGKTDIIYESNDMPDTAMIFIFSGTDTVQAGSVLFLDYLNFEYNTSVNYTSRENALTLHNIYPQPAVNKINFPVSSPISQRLEIEITDITGRKVADLQENISAGNTNIPLSVESWKPGVYMYRMNAGDQTQTGKFIVSGK